MPQLHFSVDDDTAEQLILRAKQAGQPLSRYIASLVRHQLGEAWPQGYLDAVLASCADAPIEEPEELELRPVDL